MEIGTREKKIGLVLALAGLTLMGIVVDEPPNRSTSDPNRMILASPTVDSRKFIRTSAFTVSSDFANDWYSAQKRYREALVEVNGVVAGIGEDVHLRGVNGTTIRLKTDATTRQRVKRGQPFSFRCEGGIDSYGGTDVTGHRCRQEVR